LTQSPGIRVSEQSLAHIRERHTPGGAKAQGKSLFYQDVDLVALIRQAEAVRPKPQSGRLARIVNAGRRVGLNSVTNRPASRYTVITTAAEELITAFPGVP
jgi:hypothetical protein